MCKFNVKKYKELLKEIDNLESLGLGYFLESKNDIIVRKALKLMDLAKSILELKKEDNVLSLLEDIQKIQLSDLDSCVW